MRIPFGGLYECQRKHSDNLYFFDSKPKEVPCPRCDNRHNQKLIRELDMGKSAGETLRKWRKSANKSNPVG